MDPDGNIFNADGSLDQSVKDAPKGKPDVGADIPRTDAPKVDTPATARVPERELVGVGRREGPIRLGSDVSDPVHHTDHAPGTRPDTGPGGNAHDQAKGPSASHESPTDTGRSDSPAGSGGHESNPTGGRYDVDSPTGGQRDTGGTGGDGSGHPAGGESGSLSDGGQGVDPDTARTEASAGPAGESGPGRGPWTAASDLKGPAAGKELKMPNGRHTVSGSASGEIKESNSVILRGHQGHVAQDIADIANGKATYVKGLDRYEVNGRTYGVEPSGRVYPDAGPGIVKLDRNEYAALQQIAKAKGDISAAPQLTRAPRFTNNPGLVEKALAIYNGTYS